MCEPPRFAADVMLGRLATWLRMLGFDTLYFRHIEDNELIRTAHQEHRILLTRDRELAKSRKAGRALLVRSEEPREQVREVLKAVLTTGGGAVRSFSSGQQVPCPVLPGLPRCPRCNGDLTAVERESVASEVPEHVLWTGRAFLRCRPCGKVYWEGSHKRLIDKTIQALLADIGASRKAT